MLPQRGCDDAHQHGREDRVPGHATAPAFAANTKQAFPERGHRRQQNVFVAQFDGLPRSLLDGLADTPIRRDGGIRCVVKRTPKHWIVELVRDGCAAHEFFVHLPTLDTGR